MHSAPESRGKKGMGKDDFMKMQPQVQTVLRVNMQCQCEGCRSKIRSVLKKIKGVETCKIDLEQGKVTVIGEVDPEKLIEKLSQKTDKHVELWGFPKAMNIYNINNNNQMKNIHVAEMGKGGKGGMNPLQKKGEEMINLHQMFPKAALNGKGGPPPQFKDMKMMMPPSKDEKSVQSQRPDNDDFDDEDDSDYEFDEDDLSDDDESDDGHDEGGGAKSVGGGGGGKKGFSLSNVPLLKRLGSKKEEKSENEGGNKKGDKFHIEKQGGGKNNDKKDANSLEQVKSDGKNGGKGKNIGGGGEGKNMKEGKKDSEGQAMNNAQNNLGSDISRNMGQTGRNMGPGQMGFGAYPNIGNMSGMGNYPMGGQMGNFQATQGLGVQYPPGMAAGYNNPYNNQQQPYMAMMMNQKQQEQQQPDYGNGMYNNNNPMMMMYGRPPTPPLAMDNHFTQYFNDENTNSCSIM